MTDRADRIAATLTARFAPAALRVVDDSARHAGHAGAAPGGETHYSVLVVAAAFEGMSRVAARAPCMRRWPRSSRAACTRWR